MSARTLLVALLCAGGLSAALFLGFGDVNLNLADEGYLWYGVVGVLEGEVPFRDFQAYDPGRYRWCVWGSSLFGSGILGVRASVAVFQALGLTLGLLVARRLVTSDLGLVPIALALGLWMFPRHKLFEPAIALAALWFVVRLLERPSAGRHLALGVCVGLAGWFGRNHAVYIGLAALLAFGLVAWKGAAGSGDRVRCFGALAGGVLLGYLPVLWNVAFVPGFAGAFRDAILDLLTKGANIPKPYPWPWIEDYGGARGFELAARIATTGAYLLPVVVLAVALGRVARLERGALERHAVLAGGLLVAGIYAHHAAVRSDVPHLAQCIQPALVLALAVPTGARARLAVGAFLLALTGLFVFEHHTSLRWFAPWRPTPRFHEVPIAGETLRLMGPQAQYFAGLEREVAARLAPEDEIFIAPSRPTLYPVLGKRSPVPQIYLFWFAPEEEQRAIIARLERPPVKWVLIVERAVDAREDLRFWNTHPLVWEHLTTAYERVSTPALPADHVLLRRR